MRGSGGELRDRQGNGFFPAGPGAVGPLGEGLPRRALLGASFDTEQVPPAVVERLGQALAPRKQVVVFLCLMTLRRGRTQL